jgi:hypothetical protein
VTELLLLMLLWTAPHRHVECQKNVDHAPPAGVFSGYLDFYNRRRPDSSLDSGTPDQAYFTDLRIRAAG